MKVGIFTDTYYPQINGVVTYLSGSIELLSKNNKIVLFAPGSKKLRTQRISENFKIYWIPASSFPFYEGYRMSSVNYKRISKILDKEKFDLVHAHAPVLLGLQGMIAAKRRNIPVVATYHTHFPDYIPHLLNGKLPDPFKKMGGYTVRKMIKHVFTLADAVTAPTKELVEELVSYGIKNATCIPNGIDFKKFRKNPKKTREFKEKYKIPEDKTIILYLGRISFEKKIDVLLRAFKKAEDKNSFLVVAGSGPYLDRFKKLARDLGIENIMFIGRVKDDELSAAYESADLFASASDSETFGLTFVEAMRLGVPVIAVKKLGAKEIISNRKNGILVNPEDANALANAMKKLIKNEELRNSMGSQASVDSEKYSMKNSVNKTMSLYKKLMEERKSTQ